MEKERTQMEIRLIELRKARGMTQGQLAEAIQISRQSISEWERGSSKPTQDNLLRLSELYGVSVDYLMGREEPAAPEEEKPARPAKPTDWRLWFYRILTLVLAVLLVVMLALLLTQGRKNVGYHNGETVFADELPADTIVISGEFE